MLFNKITLDLELKTSMSTLNLATLVATYDFINRHVITDL